MISIAVHRYLQFSVVESFAFFYSSLSGFVVLWQGKARLLELLTQVQLEVDGIKVSQWLHIITVGAKFRKKKSPPEQHNNVLINGHRQDLADEQVGGLKPDLTNGHFLTQKGFCHNITNFVHYLPDIMMLLCASSMPFERAVDHKKLHMVKGGISPKWQLQRVIRSSAWKRQKSGFRVKTWVSSKLWFLIESWILVCRVMKVCGHIANHRQIEFRPSSW